MESRWARTLDRMSVAVTPHPQLGVLANLIGVWEGDGTGRWGGGEPFAYREHVTFTHNGKPFLMYTQRTWAADGGRPLHTESGYWRAAEDGGVELVLAHGTGVAEIEVGRWDGTRLALRTGAVHVSPTAKTVTALERVFDLGVDELEYTLHMATDGGAPEWHLNARLRRTAR